MFTYNDDHQQSPKDASSENNKDANILILLDNQSWNKMVSMLFMFEKQVKTTSKVAFHCYWM